MVSAVCVCVWFGVVLLALQTDALKHGGYGSSICRRLPFLDSCIKPDPSPIRRGGYHSDTKPSYDRKLDELQTSQNTLQWQQRAFERQLEQQKQQLEMQREKIAKQQQQLDKQNQQFEHQQQLLVKLQKQLDHDQIPRLNSSDNSLVTTTGHDLISNDGDAITLEEQQEQIEQEPSLYEIQRWIKDFRKPTTIKYKCSHGIDLIVDSEESTIEPSV